MSWGESNRAVEDEEGEEGSIGETLKMSRLPTSPVRTHHAVPEATSRRRRTLDRDRSPQPGVEASFDRAS